MRKCILVVKILLILIQCFYYTFPCFFGRFLPINFELTVFLFVSIYRLRLFCCTFPLNILIFDRVLAVWPAMIVGHVQITRIISYNFCETRPFRSYFLKFGKQRFRGRSWLTLLPHFAGFSIGSIQLIYLLLGWALQHNI